MMDARQCISLVCVCNQSLLRTLLSGSASCKDNWRSQNLKIGPLHVRWLRLSGRWDLRSPPLHIRMDYPSFRGITIFWIIKVSTKLDTGTFKLQKSLFLTRAGCSSPGVLNSTYNSGMRNSSRRSQGTQSWQGDSGDQESVPRMAQLNAKQILGTVSATRASSPQNTGCGSRSSGIMPSAPRFGCSCHQPRTATMHTLTVSWWQVTGP
jgi:hypothetical protein